MPPVMPTPFNAVPMAVISAVLLVSTVTLAQFPLPLHMFSLSKWV